MLRELQWFYACASFALWLNVSRLAHGVHTFARKRAYDAARAQQDMISGKRGRPVAFVGEVWG